MKRTTIVFCALTLLLAGAAFSWSRGPWQTKAAAKPSSTTKTSPSSKPSPATVKEKIIVPYEIWVQTGSEKGAETGSAISIVLVNGAGRSSPEIFLNSSATCKHPFGKGQLDKFPVTVNENLGPITTIIVKSDNAGKSPEWLLDGVKVFFFPPKELFDLKYPFEGNKNFTRFKFGKWISKADGLIAAIDTTDKIPGLVINKAPKQPTGLSASAQSSASITLTWTDASTNEAGFKIEQSLSSGSGFTAIRTVNPNAASCTVNDLQPSTMYYFRVRAYNATGNSPYSNTASAKTMDAATISPIDLVVEDVTFSPSSPKNTDTVYITVKIRNQGTEYAYFPSTGAMIYSYYLDGNPYSGHFSTPSQALGPGAVISNTSYFLSPFQKSPGTYSIKVVADPGGSIAESDETNNEKTVSLTLIDGGKPDLVISAITVTPSGGTIDTTFKLEVTIKNQGDATCTSPVNAVTAVLTGDQLPGEYAQYPNQLVLQPGSTKKYIFSLGPLQPGTRTWTYTVDSGNLIPEKDETNNQSSFTTTVQETTQTGQPDLVVEDVTFSPSSPKNTDTVYVNIKIKNQGTTYAYFPSAGAMIFRYYLDGNPYSGQYSTPNQAIGPGTVFSDTGYFLSPFQKSPGTYSIKVVADPGGSIAESDETNNEKTVSLTLIDGGKPDLVISAINVTPSEGTIDTTFKLEVTIKNQGDATCTSPVNAVTAVLTGDQLPGEYAQYPYQLVLQPGSTKKYIFSLGPLEPGTRTWTYTVDGGNLIPEKDETNNQSSFTTTVQ